MIKITSTARKTTDNKGWLIDGHTKIETEKGLIAAEMTGVLIEMWHADRDAFIEAMDTFMECMKKK